MTCAYPALDDHNLVQARRSTAHDLVFDVAYHTIGTPVSATDDPRIRQPTVNGILECRVGQVYRTLCTVSCREPRDGSLRLEVSVG